MKLAAKAVDSLFTRFDHNLRGALLYGPDNGLIRERGTQFKAAFLGPAPDPLALTELNEAAILADPARLADEIASISMLSPKRFITIYVTGDKLAKPIDNALSQLNPLVFLLVIADELSARSTLRALFEKTSILAAIACYKDEPRDVRAIVSKVLSQNGLSLSPDLIDYLSHQLGNDRYVTYQELEKIILYAGDSKDLTLKDIQNLIDYNHDTQTDDLVNAVANRNLPLLESRLSMLLKEGMQPVVYLRALQRYFNRLYHIQSQARAGQTIEQAINNIKPPVFFKQQPILQQHAREWSLAQLAKALKMLIAAELACKTSDLPAIAASSRSLFQITQLRDQDISNGG